MKKRVTVICLIMVIVISVFGCGSVENSKQRPSDTELKKASTVCGMVRSVSEDMLRVQLCGNFILSEQGDCYIDIANEYQTIKEGDSVLVYYTGEMKCKEVAGDREVYNIEVCYMEMYENDGQFAARMSITSGMLADEDTELISSTVLTPVEGEPEQQFYTVLGVIKLADSEESSDAFVEKTDVIVDVKDESGEVIVTYDIDTMEVISITQ